MAVGTRVGRWRVIGHRGELAVVVEHQQPKLRYRLGVVRGEPSAAEVDAWVSQTHPVFASRVDALPWGDQRLWVLDDVDAWAIAAVMEEEGAAALAVAAVVAVDLLEALAESSGQRSIDPWTAGLDRRGHTRLRPRWIEGSDAWPASPPDDEIAGVGALLYWMLTRRPPADPRSLASARPDLPPPLAEAIDGARRLGEAAWPTPRAMLGALVHHLPPRREARAEVRELLSRFDPTVPSQWLAELAEPEHGPSAVSLPPALAPWREALQIFPPELALSLGSAVRRFARLIGPLSLDADAQSGSPDGIRGVTRRGPLERLLLSEWALFLELPEEFLRRAAMREQLHHAIAHKQPGGARRSFALFDAGPESLGRRRIAQLAILIALSGRARAARVPFAWGLIQDTRRSQIAELNPASVERLLSGRSAAAPSAVDGAEWAISLGAPAAVDDLWLIGPPGIEGAVTLGGGTRVTIQDVLAIEARAVEVALSRRGAPSRAVTLELPPEDLSVRLLRTPFARARRPPERVAMGGQLTAPLRVAPTGRRVVAGFSGPRGQGVTVLSLPRSARETAAGPFTHVPPSGSRIVAATFWCNRLFTVEHDGQTLCLWRMGPRGGPSHRWEIGGMREVDVAAGLDIALFGSAGVPASMLLRAADGTLWEWRDADPSARVLMRGARGLAQIGVSALCSVVREGAPIELLRMSRGASPAVLMRVDGEGDGALLVGAGAALMPGPGVLLRVAPERWAYDGGVGLDHPAGTAVAFQSPPAVKGLAMIALADDERSIVCGDRTIHRASSRLVAVAPSPAWPLLVALDETGQLRMLDLDGEVKLETRLTSGEDAR